MPTPSNTASASGSSSTFSYSATSSFSFSSSTSTNNGRASMRSYSETMRSDPSGTKIHRVAQESGQGAREQRLEFDAAGRKVEGEAVQGRLIEDVTDKEEGER
ncbi:hypothetical protein BDV95DRAFT_606335 [Massariosphaeria phaeospora]|uniref:Uncharacterized protein n=1 Tax=Massariosphaeria phaeospora TaxID=100035 RepID=A0A7C8MAB2_9PLEO|nr:hypothetical protein BDV95DRAFT_606335 [Massariosphaeria phaeospora]